MKEWEPKQRGLLKYKINLYVIIFKSNYLILNNLVYNMYSIFDWHKPNPVLRPVRMLILLTGYTTARYRSSDRRTNVYIETYIKTVIRYWVNLQPISPVGQPPTYDKAVGGMHTTTNRRSAIAKFWNMIQMKML